MRTNDATKRIALAGVLTAIAVVGSMLSFPVAGSKCAPVQHMVNILAAVTLGPWWGVGIAFAASLLRNILGLGSLMAFRQHGRGALLRIDVYGYQETCSYLCGGSAGHGDSGRNCSLSGGKIPHGSRTGRPFCIRSAVPGIYSGGKHSCLCADYGSGERRSVPADHGNAEIRWREKRYLRNFIL